MKAKIIALSVLSTVLSGCVSTTYTKTITVTKDAAGRTTGTVVTESITQPNQSGWPVKFEYLKNVQVGEDK